MKLVNVNIKDTFSNEKVIRKNFFQLILLIGGSYTEEVRLTLKTRLW